MTSIKKLNKVLLPYIDKILVITNNNTDILLEKLDINLKQFVDLQKKEYIVNLYYKLSLPNISYENYKSDYDIYDNSKCILVINIIKQLRKKMKLYKHPSLKILYNIFTQFVLLYFSRKSLIKLINKLLSNRNSAINDIKEYIRIIHNELIISFQRYQTLELPNCLSGWDSLKDRLPNDVDIDLIHIKILIKIFINIKNAYYKYTNDYSLEYKKTLNRFIISITQLLNRFYSPKSSSRINIDKIPFIVKKYIDL